LIFDILCNALVYHVGIPVGVPADTCFVGTPNNEKHDQTYIYTTNVEKPFLCHCCSILLSSRFFLASYPSKKNIYRLPSSRSKKGRGASSSLQIEGVQRYQHTQDYICCENLQIMWKSFFFIYLVAIMFLSV
jgi:hypothetical protein